MMGSRGAHSHMDSRPTAYFASTDSDKPMQPTDSAKVLMGSSSDSHPFLAGGGQLASLIAEYDWSATELGPLTQWPAFIKSATALILRSKIPLFMLWGRSGRIIYNEAFLPFTDARHPYLFGSKVCEGWPEQAEINEHVLNVALAGGNLSYRDQEFHLSRHGTAEQVWVNLDYSPILDEAGRPAGVLGVLIETTQKVRDSRVNEAERERLSRLFEQAPSFMALLDGPSHRFVLTNQQYTRLVGRDVTGETVATGLPEATEQGYLEMLDKVYATGERYSAFSSRFEVQSATGLRPIERFIDFVCQPIRDQSGATTGIFVQGVDVTDRTITDRRHKALSELADRSRTLDDWSDIHYLASEILGRALTTSRVGYGSIDLQAGTMHVARDWITPGVQSLAGIVHLQEYGTFLDSLKLGEFVCIADVREDARTRAASVELEQRSARSFVNVPVLHEGRLVAVLYVNDQHAREWTLEELGFIREVAERTNIATRRALAEHALRESEARFKTITNAMPQMVWSTLPDGSHDYYNHQWYEFTGVPVGSTDGEGWNDMFHPDDQSHAWDVWRHSLATGDTYEIEYRLRHRTGQYRWVLGRALPVRNAAGEITRWMGTCTDVHEQKIAQEELHDNSRRKDEFLAMLAHELRNPLAPISTAAHLLKRNPSNASHVERSAEIIGRQVRHMTTLVDDLLDVSRVTRGLVELERAPVDLKAVVGTAIEQARPLIESCGHGLTVRMDPGEVSVLGDRTRLVQVISNLLNNAANYTPNKGDLSLTLTQSDKGHVEICIRDNGIGIDAELLPRVFELFTQGHRSADRSQGGLGLGLALVRSLVELHGGGVTAQSEGAGRGSAFSVTLPLVSTTASAPVFKAQDALHNQMRSARVMVVEDNMDGAETLRMFLESEGHLVQVAHDAQQALDAVEKGVHDVFILDIGLPGMDGHDLARHLRAHRNGCAAMYIALTGYGGGKDKAQGDDAGFHHYLVKPADLDHLSKLVRSQVLPAS